MASAQNAIKSVKKCDCYRRLEIFCGGYSLIFGWISSFHSVDLYVRKLPASQDRQLEMEAANGVAVIGMQGLEPTLNVNRGMEIGFTAASGRNYHQIWKPESNSGHKMRWDITPKEPLQATAVLISDRKANANLFPEDTGIERCLKKGCSYKHEVNGRNPYCSSLFNVFLMSSFAMSWDLNAKRSHEIKSTRPEQDKFHSRKFARWEEWVSSLWNGTTSRDGGAQMTYTSWWSLIQSRGHISTW